MFDVIGSVLLDMAKQMEQKTDSDIEDMLDDILRVHPSGSNI
jgi:hypothetical protein